MMFRRCVGRPHGGARATSVVAKTPLSENELDRNTVRAGAMVGAEVDTRLYEM